MPEAADQRCEGIADLAARRARVGQAVVFTAGATAEFIAKHQDDDSHGDLHELAEPQEVIYDGANTYLDAAPARWPDYFAGWRLHDVREIILHVITETAVHAGHLDAARELIDGRTWLGPPDSQVPRD